MDPDFTDDETIKERIKTVKNKIQDNEIAIIELENMSIERDQKNRSKRIKDEIGKYKLTTGFDDTKELVHSLFKKIHYSTIISPTPRVVIS